MLPSSVMQMAFLPVPDNMNHILRDFQPEDATAVNQIALAAFDEYRSVYSDWPAFSSGIGNMSALSSHGEIIVAAIQTSIVGAVAYVGPSNAVV